MSFSGIAVSNVRLVHKRISWTTSIENVVSRRFNCRAVGIKIRESWMHQCEFPAQINQLLGEPIRLFIRAVIFEKNFFPSRTERGRERFRLTPAFLQI